MKRPNDRISGQSRSLPRLKPFLPIRLLNLTAMFALMLWVVLPKVAVGQGAEDDRIELIQVSVSEADDRMVEILFRLDESITTGSVLFHRYDPQGDVYEEIDELEVEDLEMDDSGLYFYYQDNIPDGVDPPFKYYLAFDEDGMGADVWTYRHQTILLRDVGFDLCNGSFELEWDHYTVLEKPGPSDDIIPAFFSHYRILLNGEEFDVVAFDADSGTQTLFLDIPGPGIYAIRLEAVDDPDPDHRTRFSLSNLQQTEIEWDIPRDVAIDYVRINEAGDAEMMIRGDEQHEEFAYRVFRSDNPDGGFEQVGEVPRPGNNPFEFLDDLSAQDVDAGDNIWYYRAEAALIQDDEPCEEAILISDPESSLYLFVEQERQEAGIREVTLGFNHLPLDALYRYDIARRIGEEGDFEIIVSDVTGSHVANLSDLSEDVYFRVVGEAEPVPGEPNNGWEIFSNIVQVRFELEVSIPNAFRPDSDIEVNQRFMPDFGGFVPERYRLVIFDRHGLEVFSTGNIDDGWDGSRGGSPMPEGAYQYHLRYTDAGGELQEEKGIVYLVR